MEIVRSEVDVSAGTGTVIIKSDKADALAADVELSSIAVKNAALAECSKKGLSRPALNGVPRVYPVNAENKDVTFEKASEFSHWVGEYIVQNVG